MDVRTSGLLRRLLEVAVVVGVDEVTGLQRRVLENAIDSSNLDDDLLFQLHFKAQLLDIISGTQDAIDNVSLLQTPSATQGRRKQSKPLIKTLSEKRPPPSLSRSRSVRRLRKRANKEEAVSVSTDFLSNLPYVCLPYDSRVFREAQQSQTHLAVLTDVSGSRHYAVILRVFQTFFATKNVSDSANVSWSLSYAKVSNQSVKCYAPLCVCLVANVPYFDVLKDALSCLCKDWKKEPTYELFRRKLDRFVTSLSVVPCPPPGIRITFSLNSCQFTMFPPDDINQQNNVVDIDLSIPLLVFMQNYQTLLQVLACILLEQRVVFVSNNHSLLVVAMQALLHYLTPFHWPHQYVPLLFSDRIDFVACPGIFLMGCHAMHKEKIKEVENDQILVDLDTGEVLVCASYEWRSSGNGDGGKVEPLDKLECYLPLRTTEIVVKRLNELSLFDTEHLKYPTLMSFAELHHHRTMKKFEMNKKIQNIFMDMMVDLFSNTLFYLDHEVNQFRTDEFFDTVTGYDRPFYIKVVKTYMFKKFVKERLRRTVDTFSKVAMARQRRRGTDKIRARRTFGKVRSTGDNLLPIPNRPVDMRAKTVVALNRRRSIEKKDNLSGIIRRRSMENKIGSGPSTPVLIRSGIRESRIETPPGTPDLRKSSASEFRSASVNDSLQEADFMMNGGDISADEINNNVEHLVLNLPAFPDGGISTVGFYNACMMRINVLMNGTPQLLNLQPSTPPARDLQQTHQASCLLLRGLFHIASGHLAEGLEDLHETAKEDYRMFPRSIIKDVMGSLSPDERQIVRKQTYYKGDEYYDGFEGITRVESFYYSDDDLPYKPLGKSDFSSIVELSSLTSDSDVINNLFNALSSVHLHAIDGSGPPTVDPETFSAFYSTWKQCRSDSETALRSIYLGENSTSGLLRENETILKVSSVVTSSRGTGRLILTSEKLLFMTELYEECKLMVRLTQLDEVRIVKQKNFFRSFNALAFYQNDEVLFRAAMKNDSELWKMIVDEMRIGRMLAKDLKDHLMTLDTAVQNVAVVEALYELAVDEEFFDVASALSWSRLLCNFTRLYESGEIQALPVETNQMLLLTIDLSPKETKKSQVKKILFSPAVEIEDSPRVWVTLSSSTIRMVDTTSWKLDSRPIKDCNAELSSLCMNDHELWVGSSDKTINVIDCESLRRTRVLHEHTAPVVAVFEFREYIASASSCGEIIFWDKAQKKNTLSFNMPPPHNQVFAGAALDKEIICCCCSCSISLLTSDGDRRQLLTLNEFFASSMNDSEITCFLTIGTDEIWAGDSHGYVYLWRRKRSDISPSPPLGDRHHRFKPHLSGLLCDVTVQVHITCLMATQDGKIWVGNSLGDIIILNGDSLCQERSWRAHDAAVTSLIQIENRYVISGSDSKDGKISLWRYEQLSRF